MLDEKDKKILEILKQNARLSTKGIAKRAEMPITTVHNRIKRMEKEGIIKGYSVVLDDKKLGRGVSAYILVNIDYKLLKEMKIQDYELARKIKAHSPVEDICLVTGESDIVIWIKVKDVDQLNDFTVYLRNLEGVDKTETIVVLQEI